MDLKFYLNKFLKVDNIENYTLKTLIQLRKCYEDFLEKSEGTDPDFPMIDFGGKKGKKIKGRNAFSVRDEADIENERFSKIEDRLGIFDRKQRKQDFIY